MENDATIIQQNEEMLKIQQKQYEAIAKELELLGAIYDQLKSNSNDPQLPVTFLQKLIFLFNEAGFIASLY